MEYLPTFYHKSMVHVCKYSMHGASGIVDDNYLKFQVGFQHCLFPFDLIITTGPFRHLLGRYRKLQVGKTFLRSRKAKEMFGLISGL